MKERRMYVSVDLISRTVSPIQYFDNDYSAYKGFSDSISLAQKNNASLDIKDFTFLYVGTIRDDGFISPDYKIITSETVSDVNKMKDDFIADMKKNVELYSKS